MKSVIAYNATLIMEIAASVLMFKEIVEIATKFPTMLVMLNVCQCTVTLTTVHEEMTFETKTELAIDL